MMDLISLSPAIRFCRPFLTVFWAFTCSSSRGEPGNDALMLYSLDWSNRGLVNRPRAAKRCRPFKISSVNSLELKSCPISSAKVTFRLPPILSSSLPSSSARNMKFVSLVPLTKHFSSSSEKQKVLRFS